MAAATNDDEVKVKKEATNDDEDDGRTIGSELREWRSDKKKKKEKRALGLLLLLLGAIMVITTTAVLVALLVVTTTTGPSSSTTVSAQSTTADPSNATTTNVLFIVLDQLRYDALGFIQNRMASTYGNYVKVRTPNIDRLAAMGVSFETTYCQSASCSPSRATMKTGCTVARHGVVNNYAASYETYNLMAIFRNRINNLVSFEEILQHQLNYRVETYGKWHAPIKWYENAVHFNYYSYQDQLFHFAPEMTFRNRYRKSLAYFNTSAYETLEKAAPGQTTLINRYSNFPYTPIQIDARVMAGTASASPSSMSGGAGATTVDELATVAPDQHYHYSKVNMTLSQTRVTSSPINTNAPRMNSAATTTASPIQWNTKYPRRLESATVAPQQQQQQQQQPQGSYDSYNAFTDDGSGGGGGGSSSNASSSSPNASWGATTAIIEDGENVVSSGDRGRDALAVNYTSSAIEGDMALRALRRLVAESTIDPFFLSVHFLSPHPPMVATGAYLSYYWNRRNNLYVPPSITDSLTYSAYRYSRNRKPGFTNPGKLRELVAVYYAMIEEVDHHIGLLLDTLEESGLLSSTMIVLTSDHGEMMGAHGMQGKALMYEEATRVPLIMVNPKHFPPSSVGTVIKEPVSQLDLHATLLDYLGGSQYDTGDGNSLRRFIERTSYNRNYDERVVVVEDDGRSPVSTTKLLGKLGDRPNFMVRRGPFVLTLPRLANSTVIDMMFHLQRDRGQVVNLLRDPSGANWMKRSAIVGKAEHLKILLLEYMTRNNGAGLYYTSPKYQPGGRGDVNEITSRRTWGQVNYWHSDDTLTFGPPSKVGSVYVRNEYWYVGRTRSGGTLQIQGVSVNGTHASYFQVPNVRQTIVPTRYVRIKVSFRSSTALNWKSLRATLLVKNSATGTTSIPLVFSS